MWWQTCCHSLPFKLSASLQRGHIHDLGSVWIVSKCVFKESSSSNVSPQQHWFFLRQVSLAVIKVTFSSYSFFLYVKASSLSFDIFAGGATPNIKAACLCTILATECAGKEDRTGTSGIFCVVDAVLVASCALSKWLLAALMYLSDFVSASEAVDPGISSETFSISFIASPKWVVVLVVDLVKLTISFGRVGA